MRPPRPGQQPPAGQRRPPRVHRAVQAVVRQVAAHEADAHRKRRRLHGRELDCVAGPF